MNSSPYILPFSGRQLHDDVSSILYDMRARPSSALPVTRIPTPVGTVYLLPDVQALASGFVALTPELSDHHATPDLTVYPCGRLELDGVFLVPSIVPHLEAQLHQALLPHLDTFRIMVRPVGFLSVRARTLRVRVGSGEVVIRDEKAYLAACWSNDESEVNWAVLPEQSTLKSPQFSTFTEVDQAALLTFNSALLATYADQREPGAPFEVMLQALRQHAHDLDVANEIYRRHWANFTLKHVREALSV